MERKDIMLAALAAGGKGVVFSPVQVQKLFFLIDREASELVGGPHFEFVPYDFGPFDSAVYDELHELASENLVEILPSGTYRKYILTREGYEIGAANLDRLPSNVSSYVSQVVEWMEKTSFQQLVAAIYKAYPDMKEKAIFRQ